MPRLAVAVHRGQSHRHAEPGEQFEVRQMCDPIGAKAVGEPGDRRRIVSTGEHHSEPVRRKRARWKRGNERD